MFQDQCISRRCKNDEAIFHRTSQPSDSNTQFMIKGLGNKSFGNLISVRESNEWVHVFVLETCRRSGAARLQASKKQCNREVTSDVCCVSEPSELLRLAGAYVSVLACLEIGENQGFDWSSTIISEREWAQSARHSKHAAYWV